jgi:hypothetical protein
MSRRYIAPPGAAWFDPIEVVIRDRVRGFIEELVEAELDDALGRSRCQRPGTANAARGGRYRPGRRERHLLGSVGPVTSCARGVGEPGVPLTARPARRRARLEDCARNAGTLTRERVPRSRLASDPLRSHDKYP